MRRQIFKQTFFLLCGLLYVGLFGMLSQSAAAAGPSLVNFQGKVVNADGTNVTNGTYNFNFVLFDDPSLGTESDGVHDKWHELNKSVTVTNGVFQTNLGSATALPDFNANPSLYLAVKFNGDAAGYMTPRIQLSSVPYALNSDKLGGMTSGNFVQLAQGSQTDSSTTNPSIFINKTNASGTPNILQLQKSSSDVFVINNSGLVSALQGISVTGATTVAGVTLINNSGTASTTIGNSAGGTITIGASSGSDLVLNDANWSVNSAGNAAFAQVTSPTYTSTAGLTINSGNNALTIDATDTTLSATGLTGITLGTATTVTTSSNGDLTLAPNGTGSIVVKAGSTATPDVFEVQDNAGLVVSDVNTSTTPNLVSNPSFESNINGWSAKGASTVTYDRTAANAQFGNATLKMVNTAANDGAKYSVPLKASTTYSVSFYAKTASGSTTAILGRQENGSDVETSCASFSVTTTWTQFTCANFTTGATINGTSNIYIRQTVAGTPTIFIDGVTLAQAATGLTFDEGGNNFNLQSLSSNITLNNTATGDLQPWQLNASGLTANREGAVSVTSNGYIYNIGGYDGTNRQNTVMYAPMNADGSTGTWSTTTAMTVNSIAQNRQLPAAAVANGYVYVIGGIDSSGTHNTIMYAKLNSDGTVGSWYCQGAQTPQSCGISGQLPTNGNGLPAGRMGSAAVVSNGFIYVVGGCSDSSGCTSPVNTVYYAKLQADGSTGPWNTSASTLSQARGLLTAMFANGYIVAMGGNNGTAGVTTVDKAQIASSGDLAANFSTTGMTALPANRQEHTSVIANGYLYVIGGSDGAASPARQTTVYYSKLNAASTNNAWQTNPNALPAGRSGQSTAIANGYVYVLGGCGQATAGSCGTNQTSTVEYASTARVLIGGTLDLVGLTSQTISEYGGGGALIAGNGRFIGDLKVDGYADFNNGLSIDSGLNINAVSSTAGQAVLNINNLNSNSIFSVRHMSTNFGSLASAGAFMDKNSYWGEEFNVGHVTACNTTAALSAGTVNGYARGDYGGSASTATACASGAVANVGGGEMNVADVIGTALTANNQCLISSQNAVNGIERISAAVTTAVAGSKAACVENLAGNATTSNKIYSATNLPVIAAKVKIQAFTANAGGSVFVVGANIRDHPGTDGAGANLPNTGIFFTNCSTFTAGTGVPNGCTNTNWYGMVTSGNSQVGSTQNCTGPGTLSSSNFAYLRIEVRAQNDIHFFSDFNTSDGITETECGSGVTSSASSSAMTPWIEAKAVGNAVVTNTLDVDYFRSWQDDNVPLPETPPQDQTAPSASQQQALTVPPLSVDPSSDPAAAQSDFLNFDAASSEDTVFSKDVYVKGTLFANKIKANQIEGLELFTDKINSLQTQLTKDKAAATTANGTPTTGAPASPPVTPGLDVKGAVNFNNAEVVNLVALAQIESRGGLVVDKTAQFNGKTIFQLLAEFNGAANFHGQVTFDKQPLFNKDAGGVITIKKGEQKAEVTFASPYSQTPLIVANWAVDTDDPAAQARLFKADYKFFVSQTTPKDFTVILNKPAEEDLTLTWLAAAVKDAKISGSTSVLQ